MTKRPCDSCKVKNCKELQCSKWRKWFSAAWKEVTALFK